MLPALIVAAWTAWFLGIRIGLIVGGAFAVAFLVSMVIPGMTITVWALAIAWSAALYFFGPKISKAAGKSSLLGGAYGQARSWASKIMGKKP